MTGFARTLPVGVAAIAVACGAASSLDGPSRPAPVSNAEPAVIPVGYDAYRSWDRLPYLHLGARTYMRSTYDRTGGNESADASHYLREVAPGADVALDVDGSGYLYFFRANQWHGSPWRFGIDGTDYSVSDTATATPDAPPPTSTFLPEASFPAPLALTYATTQGADVSWVPMGFTQSLSITHGHSHYGTGYYIYTLYDPGAPLSHPVTAWSDAVPPPSDVVALLGAAGTDIAPTGHGVTTNEGSVDVPAGAAATLVDLAGPTTIRALRLTIPSSSATDVADAHLRITWDGRASPSVDAPLPLFFGAGTLYNRANVEYLVKSLPAVVRFAPGTIELSMYFPMPFQRAAHVEIVGGAAPVPNVAWQVRSTAFTDPPEQVGYFHASYVDSGTPVPGKDLVFLDTTAVEGGGDWCGTFVGTSFIFSDQAILTTLEGDPRFFFDDSMTPQAQGTGTEEWGAGGGYWVNGQITTLPLAGHPLGATSPKTARNAEDEIESAYRFLVADAFPFGRNARIQLEHGAVDDSTEHYRSVAYWYGTPSACLVPTDALHVSDPGDESAHQYAGPAADVDTVTSRYEWGVDHVGATEIYPATTDTGRHGSGPIEFVLTLRPDNFGALLRRKLDYAFPDQRAQVFVGDAAPGAPLVPVGTWYLAGSNTVAYVDAPSETGVVAPTMETSNRQWRDDEFLLPRAQTRGKDQVRVRIVPAPGSTWSEYRYTVYSYVMPSAP